MQRWLLTTSRSRYDAISGLCSCIQERSERMAPSNKGMNLAKRGQLRSFAGYPQCWADSLERAIKRPS
jgi:hypothetical protein